MAATLFERALAAISPQAAIRRTLARQAFENIRGYDAGKPTRKTEGWLTPGTDVNAEIGGAAAWVRQRARELVRNNGYAAHGKRVLVTGIWGSGIVPRVDPRDETMRQQTEDDWNEWVEYCDPEGRLDFYALGALITSTIVESGGALVEWIEDESRFDSREIPLRFRVLEPDYFDLAKTESLKDGHYILQGVEYDARHRRVAYWLFDQHPGDVRAFASGRYQSRRHAAEKYTSIFDILRPGQVHGISWFAPAVLRLKDSGEYEHAELMRKKIEACFAVFVKQTTERQLDAGAQTQDGERLERLKPALVHYLGRDEDISIASPAATQGYGEYLDHLLRAVAAGLGVTFEQLTGNLKNVNYSSLRGGLLQHYAALEMWQQNMMIAQFCRQAWMRFNVARRKTGRLQSRAPRVLWHAPPKRWLDPLKEAQANTERLKNFSITPQQLAAEQGLEAMDVINSFKEFIDAANSAEVPLPWLGDTSPATPRQPPVEEKEE
jgi:lambda family phage portal protein